MPELDKFPDGEGKPLSLDLILNGKTVGSISIKVKINKLRDFKSAKVTHRFVRSDWKGF